jgi:hypothetical protein
VGETHSNDAAAGGSGRPDNDEVVAAAAYRSFAGSESSPLLGE